MSLKNLLLHIDDSEESAPSLTAALSLASAQAATLTGLYAIAGLDQLKFAFGRDSSSLQERRAKAEIAAMETERGMKLEAAARGVFAGWLLAEGDPAVSMAMASRFFDLAIAYRHAPASTIGWNVAEEVLMSGGRPCVVLPPSWSLPFGSRAIVAWNASRESSRALDVAMPILQHASVVSVLVGPPRDQFRAVVRSVDLDLRRHLERHGIEAEFIPFDVGEESAGRAILREAYARGADLIVMGAYGRSWATQWMLGGTTRCVLREAEVPMLMSC